MGKAVLPIPRTRRFRTVVLPARPSFTDVERLIRLFSKEGHTVLYPFVGAGSTWKADALEQRTSIGIEPNQYSRLSRRNKSARNSTCLFSRWRR